MTAIMCILTFVVAGVAWGVLTELFEQRRLRNMAEDVRRRG